jgi:ABC-type antimicrobial peptide transport system permease subunit
VLGFTRSEVSAILLGELAIEIVLALPLGMGLGYLLSSAIVSLIQTDEFYFPFVIEPAPTYLPPSAWCWPAWSAPSSCECAWMGSTW